MSLPHMVISKIGSFISLLSVPFDGLAVVFVIPVVKIMGGGVHGWSRCCVGISSRGERWRSRRMTGGGGREG
jgi:hypothetical protein